MAAGDLRTRILWSICLAPVTATIGYFSRGVLEAWGVLDPYAELFGRLLRSTDPKLILDFAAAALALLLYCGALLFIWWRRRTPNRCRQDSDCNAVGRTCGTRAPIGLAAG